MTLAGRQVLCGLHTRVHGRRQEHWAGLGEDFIEEYILFGCLCLFTVKSSVLPTQAPLGAARHAGGAGVVPVLVDVPRRVHRM